MKIYDGALIFIRGTNDALPDATYHAYQQSDQITYLLNDKGKRTARNEDVFHGGQGTKILSFE